MDVEVACWNCRAEFMVSESGPCSCLVPRRTLVCPYCLSCSCKAPDDFKQDLWSRVPVGIDSVSEPRNAVAARTRSPSSSTALPWEDLKRPLVLVIDDDDSVLEITALIAKAMGYGLITAPDGREGLELAQQHVPDLILSDIMMPRMDGGTLCNVLGSSPRTADIPVVLMTANRPPGRSEEDYCQDLGALELFYKPIRLNDLQDLLGRHLGPPEEGPGR